MPRTKKTKPKFKVGDWVRLSEGSRDYDVFNPLQGKGPWKILSMHYDEVYEENPSPWYAVLDLQGVPIGGCFWEEHIQLDVFMTTAHAAVERRTPVAKKKAHTAQV